MSQDPAPANSPNAVPNTHPKAFYFFFWGEFAERCSYYGMRAILPLYLTGVLAFRDDKATEIYSYFKAACYLLPLLGGFLADRCFGKYWTIVGFSIPYVIGQFLLCVPNEMTLYLALILLACGSGVIKPNISTLMGLTYDQQRPGKELLRSSAFQWFYFAINIGAFISLLALPFMRNFIRDKSGSLTFAYQTTFLVPAVFMVGALAAFALGKKHYAVEVIGQAQEKTPEELRQQWATLASLFGLFGLMVFWWVAYEQNDNVWTFFARDFMNCNLFGVEFPPDGFQFLNAVLVLVFIPIFDIGLRKIDPQRKVFKPTFKMLLGFVITAFSAGAMAMAADTVVMGETGKQVLQKASAWWIVFAYLVLTIGEVLIYGTGLELAYTAAPASMKGFITACFLLTNTGGNLVNSQLSQLYNTKLTPRDFFLMTMGITLVAALAFFFVGRRFNRMQAAEAQPEPTPLLGDPVDMERT